MFIRFMILWVALLGFAGVSLAETCSYDRDEWGFNSRNSPVSESRVGFYTAITVGATDVDHVVSLKDASDSGGCYWTKEQKRNFANDSTNHVAALPRVNRIKSSHPPKRFIADMEAKNYKFVATRKCDYISNYVGVKEKYGLSFTDNDMHYLARELAFCMRFLQHGEFHSNLWRDLVVVPHIAP